MSRPTVCLLHSFPLGPALWDGQRRVLADAGWASVAPSLPPDGGRSFDAWAGAVLRLVPGPLVPVGNSMGGYLAFALWRRAPERIAALGLVDTKAGGETEEARRGREETISLIRAQGVAAFVPTAEARLLGASAPADARARFRELALERSAGDLVCALTAIRDRPDSTGLLRGLRRPALVVVGEEDAVTPPSEAEAMASLLPDARLVRVPRCGHVPSLEAPDALNRALLDFLAELG